MSIRHELDALVEEGYVHRAEHPSLPLAIYDYTDKCVAEKLWNPYTLRAHGMIIDMETDLIVARSFPKIFTIGETAETAMDKLPLDEGYRIFESVNGPLGVVFNYRDEWHYATTRSFTSEECIKGELALGGYRINSNWKPTNTYLVKRPVYTGLILLGGYKVNDGVELGWDYVQDYANRASMRHVNRISTTLTDLIESKPGSEWIVRFNDGLRCIVPKGK